jgi:hypothetical protein
MPADLSTVNDYLKTKFGPAIVSQLNDETALRSRFFVDSGQDWVGSEVTYPVHVNRNRGVMATTENGNLPTAGAQKLEKVHIPLRYVHGRVQFTGQAIKQSKSNPGAWARTMTLEMDRLVEDLYQQFEFYYFGYGSGVRCLLSDDPGTTTDIDVDAPLNVAGATHGNRYLNVGDYVVAISPLGVLRAGGTRLITAVNADGTDFTINAAADTDWQDNDFIVKAYGNDASIAIENTEFNHAPMGILGMLDDGTFISNFHGISRDTYPIFRTPVLSAVGGLSLDIIQRGLDVADQVGAAKITELWMHQSVRRAYLNLLNADRRYIGADLMNPDGGTKVAKQGKLAYGGSITIEPATQCPYGTIFGIDPRQMVRYVNTPGEWMDEDGSILSRVSGVDAFEGTYRCYENGHYERPNAGCRWDGVNATVVVAHII